MDINLLSAFFDPAKVHWRVGATNQKAEAKKTNNPKAPATMAIALAYIDARDVMDRLDSVCGVANWQSKYEHASNHGYVCSIGIRIGDEWVWKANGAGETQVEAQKGAMSDSFKRAAVLWGVGRYLYDIPNTWVAIDKYKNIEKHEFARLARTLPNAPKQQAPKQQETPFDEPTNEDQAQLAADELVRQCADIVETIEGISELHNLAGYMKTGMVKDFYNAAPQEIKEQISKAAASKRSLLEERSKAA